MIDRTIVRCLGCALGWIIAIGHANAAERAADRILRGSIDASANHSYRLLPFEVPAGVAGLEIRFAYSGRESRTTIDLGLLAPGEDFAQAFRGWRFARLDCRNAGERWSGTPGQAGISWFRYRGEGDQASAAARVRFLLRSAVRIPRCTTEERK